MCTGGQGEGVRRCRTGSLGVSHGRLALSVGGLPLGARPVAGLPASGDPLTMSRVAPGRRGAPSEVVAKTSPWLARDMSPALVCAEGHGCGRSRTGRLWREGEPDRLTPTSPKQGPRPRSRGVTPGPGQCRDRPGRGSGSRGARGEGPAAAARRAPGPRSSRRGPGTPQAPLLVAVEQLAAASTTAGIPPIQSPLRLGARALWWAHPHGAPTSPSDSVKGVSPTGDWETPPRGASGVSHPALGNRPGAAPSRGPHPPGGRDQWSRSDRRSPRSVGASTGWGH